MSHKQRAWLMIAGVAAICGGTIGGVAWYRSRNVGSTAGMMRRLRTRDAVVCSVDFAALRQSGILQMFAVSKVATEPEYQSFVQKTGFDYTQDLDLALVSAGPAGKFFLLKGRFDWQSLRAYVAEQHGSCYNTLCRMDGSAKERKISFFPLRTDIMAMAVSPDDSAADHLRTVSAEQRPIYTPQAPVWISFPPAALESGDALPAGTRMFARGLAAAENVTVSLGPNGGRFEAKLYVDCRSQRDASALAEQLGKTTALLREMIEREHQKPNPGDLSGVLTAGSFRSDGSRVYGYWPIEKAFFENLLGPA